VQELLATKAHVRQCEQIIGKSVFLLWRFDMLFSALSRSK
jgi:hypothetical protein